MQVSVQKLSPVLVEFAVEIPADLVKVEMENAYQRLTRAAHIKGYRPGKIPRDVLTHVFGSRIAEDVAQRLVDTSLPKALQEKSVQPLATVSVSPSKVVQSQPFSYRVRFEVAPDIDDVKYENFEVKKPVKKVSDEMIAAELSALQREQAELRAPDPARPAQVGDTVVIDFHLQVGNKLIGEASGSDVQAELGSGKLLPELDQALQGASVGEHRHVTVTFGKNHPRAQLRGKNGTFHVDLKEVKERILPTVDDEFAKDLGSHETLNDLRQEISHKLEKQLEAQAEEAIAEQIVNALCNANPVDVPPTLVEKQTELMENELRQQLRQNGQATGINAEVHERVRADAQRRVQAGLLMAAIAKAKEIKVTDEDMENAYKELAEESGKNVARVKAEYREQQKREMLMGMILEDKILKLIQEKATVVEEAVKEP